MSIYMCIVIYYLYNIIYNITILIDLAIYFEFIKPF